MPLPKCLPLQQCFRVGSLIGIVSNSPRFTNALVVLFPQRHGMTLSKPHPLGGIQDLNYPLIAQSSPEPGLALALAPAPARRRDRFGLHRTVPGTGNGPPGGGPFPVITSCQNAHAVSLPDLHAGFLAILPRIQRHAHVYFRHLRPERKQEMVAEALAQAWKWYRRPVEHGKDVATFPSALATYAARRRGCRPAPLRPGASQGRPLTPGPASLPLHRLHPSPPQLPGRQRLR